MPRIAFLSLGIGLLTAPTAFSADAAPSAPTFDKDILPIFQKHCQTCHRPGEVGPMPLLDYDGVRPWAKAIKAAVLTKKMPPWYADPKFGHFRNDRRLSDADIHKIAAWVDAGAPEGDAKDKPEPIAWTEGWNIRPDEIFQMPDPYVIPAKDSLAYVYVVIPTGFTKDTWVNAAEIRPSARAVVHHALAVVRPPGSTWMKDAKPYVPYIPPDTSNDGMPEATDPLADPVSMVYELLAAYAPGAQPQRFDVDHSAKLIPAGSDIILQLHYTANGKKMEDRTRVGIEIASKPPQKRFMSAVANGWKWAIPPGDPNYEGHARLTFGEPVELVFIQPHMHLRGKDMSVAIAYPDGKKETLLYVPHYDFNWQIIYYLTEPLKLPQGTKVEVTAHWDNSANNPTNPDPTKTVVWGNQSWDEMLSVPMGVIVDRD
jgi:mono/diheme cytochrome c family protein